MDRTHAGDARACDGFRTPDRRTPDGGAARRAGRRPLATFLTGLGALAILGAGLGACGPAGPGRAATSRSGAAATGSTVAAAAARSGEALTLLAQSPYVGPGQAFALRLAIGSSVPKDTTLTVTVYQHLTSRSAFVETVNGTVVGAALSTSSAIALSSLPADPAGGVDLSIPVVAGAPAASSSSAPFTADLHCTTGGCGGVYPVRLQLGTPPGGGARPQLLTNLVYEDPPATTARLRVALVTPLSLPANPASASGHVTPVDAGALSTLSSVTGAFAGRPDVAATVPASPSTVTSLAADPRPRARQLLDQIQALSAAGAHESLAGPFAAVDPAALMGAGLPSELASQVQRGAQALAAGEVHATPGTWVAQGVLDQSTLGQLAGLGYDQAVVPASSVPANLFRLTPDAPVTVPDGRGANIPVALEDPVLSQQLSGASVTGPDAVLAANQVLADLALIYYEQPNLVTPRGVVALSPPLWSPDPAFLDTLLAGLSANPVLQPATLATLFATVPPAQSTALRRSTPDPTVTLPARAIRTTRGEIGAFATAVSDPTVPRGLSDLLLTAESDLLRPPRQAAGVAGANRALHDQLGRVSVNSDSIRLTSSTAHVPVTIVKTAPYTVTAVMTVASDKLLFPHGSTRTVVLDRPTNAVYVNMQARTGGVFRVTVTLLSPEGGLVIAGRELTVRSMSTSAVAIGLSLGAVVVLLAWWGRTLWRGGRGAHRRRPGSPSAPSPPDGQRGEPAPAGAAGPPGDGVTG